MFFFRTALILKKKCRQFFRFLQRCYQVQYSQIKQYHRVTHQPHVLVIFVPLVSEVSRALADLEFRFSPFFISFFHFPVDLATNSISQVVTPRMKTYVRCSWSPSPKETPVSPSLSPISRLYKVTSFLPLTSKSISSFSLLLVFLFSLQLYTVCSQHHQLD